MSTFRLLIFFLLFAASLSAQYPAAPDPIAYVTDLGDFLTEEEELNLSRVLLNQYREKGQVQLVVVTVPDLGGQSVEQYAQGLAESWGIGEKDWNNGVLLLLSRAERKVRIELGYGMEGQITDLEAKRIIDEKLVPYLKMATITMPFW